MQSIKYYDLTPDQKEQFFDFLKDCSKELDQPAYENMWDDEWHDKKNTLPYILEKTDRFKNNGFYQILFDGDTIVACSGAYRSHFCDDVAILGNRTWIHKDHRNRLLVRDYLLPAEKAWAIQEGYKAVALTFNDYNKNLAALWKRKRLGDKRTPIQPYNFGYKYHIVDFPVNVQYTKQWLIYDILDESFKYDWEQIRWVDS